MFRCHICSIFNIPLLCFALIQASALKLSTSNNSFAGELIATRQLPQNYTSFLHAFGLADIRAKDTPEQRRQREGMFWQRYSEVLAQNTRPGSRWKASANHLMDSTPEEFERLLGYRRTSMRTPVASFLSLHTGALQSEAAPTLPEMVDWRKLESSQRVRNQGSCGSCWAISTVGAMEMHLELKGRTNPRLSFSELLNCVPNPKQCGGSGGCSGATAELAFEYIQTYGLSTEDSYAHASQQGESCSSKKGSSAVYAMTQHFVQLPVNRVRRLLHAVATKGPIVVSVDASAWGTYGSGIFDSCGQDSTVNHAVLLVGYGKTEQDKYWIIRNSWGPGFGEDGFIRLLRHDREDAYCGTDYDPRVGVGCLNGPTQMKVCGMCGVLSDSAYPEGVQLSS